MLSVPRHHNAFTTIATCGLAAIRDTILQGLTVVQEEYYAVSQSGHGITEYYAVSQNGRGITE